MTEVVHSGILDAIKDGRAILFLGAGASIGAVKADGSKIPDGKALARILSQKFLGGDYDDAPFKTVYDFACSARSVRDVQTHVHNVLSGFDPADFHKLIPTFAWAGIATTNFDLIIERAYEKNPLALQEIVPYCEDADDAAERVGERGVLYVKLHGCITRYQSITPPLIASTEQIIAHKEGRAGQFAQFLEWGRTKTIIFAGYAFNDDNLRTLIDLIRRDGDGHPRHFIVRPGILKPEADYWMERRIHTVATSFESFIRKLDLQWPTSLRKLALTSAAETSSSFTRFIAKAGASESSSLLRYLESGIEHVFRGSDITPADPKKFYRGFDLGWFPMTGMLDVSRRIGRTIYEEYLVPSTESNSPKLILIKGHAGSGKSVVLRRLAWDTAQVLDRLVFRLQSGDSIDLDRIEEIVGLTNQNMYLFIDDVADGANMIAAVMIRGRKQKWPLVIVGGVRINEWNMRCDELEPLVDEAYELKYLTDFEIDGLLANLLKHDALGYLTQVSADDRRRRLKESYGRQILVALHEATENATFRDIIKDEYRSILPPEAQLLYLDICSLYRFGSPVRAGLISRVHGIDFDEFRQRFFKPLEEVIDLSRDSKTQDYVYKARHPVIADMVYDVALPRAAEKFDALMRIIGRLNPSYSYDREVLFQLIRASVLSDIFPDITMGHAIYDAATDAFGETPLIQHQRGIYEMRRAGDEAGLNRAEGYLGHASEAEPYNASIKHSLAELDFKRASLARTDDDRAMWLRQAETQARALAQKSKNSYPLHTLAKISVARVRDAVERSEKVGGEIVEDVLDAAIKDAEDVIRTGLQRFPNDAPLLTEEANLGNILQNADRALVALEKASKSNPRSELIARRLARILNSKGRSSDAITVLRNTLERSPGSTVLHYDLARTLMNEGPAADVLNGEVIHYHLRRSFNQGDRNHEARFWYARQLCLVGNWRDALPIFRELRNLHIPYSQKKDVRGIVINAEGSAAEYYGQIYQKRDIFGFIRSDQDGMEIFVSSDDMLGWENVKVNQRVKFALGFNLQGPVAQDVKLA